MSNVNYETAQNLLESADSDHEIVEIRKHDVSLGKKHVITLVFRFERYE